MSATLQLQQTTGPVRRLVTVDPQGFRFVKNPLVPTFDTILGPRSQTLEQIGQTRAMVLRMRMAHGADAEPCRLQRRTRDEGRTVKTFTEMNGFTYLDGPRESSGATRDPRGHSRWPPECPDCRRTVSTHSRSCEGVKIVLLKRSAHELSVLM